ncbi:hypothetical protein D9613_001084 [Agrocybe pediades]|uniref:BTB domain-containing protein n=1 Tax=Agrocybe pediades TaxID=84607 RepID=A0A8H4R0U1_9AGAR|nr:hypothetical protein D9613_001084 [Agrocybe pediades]
MLGDNSASSDLGWGTVAEISAEEIVPIPKLVTPKSPGVVKLDDVFNFQIVVFQVEDTVFEVLKAGFNVPETIFETMFTLPQRTPVDADGPPVEGSSRDHPIVLEGVKADEFRIFLRILYPFMVQSEVTEYDEWISVLHLATMWDFKKIRTNAINRLQAEFFTQKSAAEKISVGRKYRVVDWVKDGYKTLCQEPAQNLEEMKRLKEAHGLDWEDIAKIYFVRDKLRRDHPGHHYCDNCSMYFGREPDSGRNIACRCRYTTAIEEVFKSDFSFMNGIDPLSDTPTTVTANKKKKKK